MLEAYSPCPCGSGKKFKWCCQPIYVDINRALEQEANGQHEAALRILDQLTQAHESNPEVWGQKAKLLYAHGKGEEAEAALEKAFRINPNYPFGLLMQATLRYTEGEIAGALLLARRAADAYDPEARSYLAEAYSIIFSCEMRLNRPVAARAALQLILHYMPAEEDPRKHFDALFGPQGRLPAAARQAYTFLPPPTTLSGPQRQRWQQALTAGGLRLSDLPGVFEPLTAEGNNAAAWFNLGLARAWLGDNVAALEALERYLDLETDEAAATRAAALGEVLRLGQGLENESDYCEYSFVFPLRDSQAFVNLVNEWSKAGRLVPLQTQQEGVFLALVLETSKTSLITAGSPGTDTATLAGYLALLGNFVRVTSPLKEPFERLRDDFRQRLALTVNELQEQRGPLLKWEDTVADALIFPLRQSENAAQRVLEHAQRHFEEVWIHRPRRSLAGNTPVDAVGHARLRKKLLGVIEFLQECAAGSMLSDYDFNRLRRKLGLTPGAASPTPAGDGAASLDIAALGAGELAGLSPEGLSDAQLEQAYQAALKLDAGELTARFAQALVARPPQTDRPDRFPWYSFLVQKALRDGDTSAALDYVNEGEKADCEHNEGRRRNDYELRRAQVHAKRGEVDLAEDVFRRLIERVPDNARYRGLAAEAMLGLRQGARAQRFAEEGLEVARQANDRDSEAYLQELAAAAKKQLG